MNLTKHFTLDEMTVTESGLPNTPDQEAVRRLTGLCAGVLEPWRVDIGAIHIDSGFRSKAVNDYLRAHGYSASTTSQHMVGEAADSKPLQASIEEAWKALLNQKRVDQAIIYQRKRGAGWIHVSHSTLGDPRREFLVQLPDGHTYVPWSKFNGALVLP